MNRRDKVDEIFSDINKILDHVEKYKLGFKERDELTDDVNEMTQELNVLIGGIINENK